MIDVQLPDGNRIRVDTTDPQAAAAAAKKYWSAKPRRGIGDAVIDAATLGLSDEVKAAGAATGDLIARQLGANSTTGSFGGDYNRALAEERAKLADLTTGEQIAGAVVAAPTMVAKLPAQAAAAAAPILRGLLTGAGTGAAYGAGSAEGGAVDRLAGGAVGGAVGGVAGAAVPAAIGGAQAAARAFQPDAPLQRALNRVAVAASRSGTDLASLDPAATAGPGATIAEAMGDSGRRLARAVAAVPGESGQLAADVLEPRSRTMGEDITRAARDVLGNANAYDAVDALTARQRAQAGPLFERASQQPIAITPEIEELLSRPAAKAALARAADIARNSGDAAPDLSSGSVPTRALHYVRQALDDQLEAYRDGVTGKMKLDALGNSIRGIRDTLDQQMKGANPLLQQADQLYASDAAAKDAVARGREFLRRRPEEIDRAFAKLSPAERDHYRLGVAQALDDVMNDVARGNSVTGRLADIPNVESKIRAVFPTKENADDFIKLLTDKRAQQDFRNFVLRGSRTTPLAEDIADLRPGRSEMVVDAARAVRGNLGSIANLARVPVDYARAGFSERTRNAIGSILFETDPAKQRALLDQVLGRQKTIGLNKTAVSAAVPSAAMIAEQRRRKLLGLE